MSERLDRIERALEFMLDRHAQFEADIQLRQERFEAEMKEREKRFEAEFQAHKAISDKEMKQLRRVLLSAIRIGVRDRTKINRLIDALTTSQLRLETKVDGPRDSQ